MLLLVFSNLYSYNHRTFGWSLKQLDCLLHVCFNLSSIFFNIFSKFAFSIWAQILSPHYVIPLHCLHVNTYCGRVQSSYFLPKLRFCSIKTKLKTRRNGSPTFLCWKPEARNMRIEHYKYGDINASFYIYLYLYGLVTSDDCFKYPVLRLHPTDHVLGGHILNL